MYDKNINFDCFVHLIVCLDERWFFRGYESHIFFSPSSIHFVGGVRFFFRLSNLFIRNIICDIGITGRIWNSLLNLWSMWCDFLRIVHQLCFPHSLSHSNAELKRNTFCLNRWRTLPTSSFNKYWREKKTVRERLWIEQTTENWNHYYEKRTKKKTKPKNQTATMRSDPIRGKILINISIII